MDPSPKIQINERVVFRYCPLCAASLELRFAYGVERPVCPACGWVHFDDPKVAAAALVMKGSQVLLVQRANAPGAGMWSLPAGFVDAGEDPGQAAVRECREETGIEVKVVGLLEVISGREHPRGADILIVYACEITGGFLAAGDDAQDASFFEKSMLPPLAFRATRLALGCQEES